MMFCQPQPELEDWEPCLICSTLIASSTVLKVKVTPQVPPGLDVDTPVNDHLWPIFLLRKVLQLEQKECEKLLQQTEGLNPGSWFKICEPCCETVNGAFRIHKQISQMEWSFEQLREEVREKLKDSLENPQDVEEGRVFSPRKIVRDYVAARLLSNCDSDIGGNADLEVESDPLIAPTPSGYEDANDILVDVPPQNPLVYVVSVLKPPKAKRRKAKNNPKRYTGGMNEKINCLYPHATTSSALTVRRNPKFSNQGYAYYCPACPFKSRYYFIFTRHRRNVHCIIEKPLRDTLTCRECSFRAKTTKLLNQHQKQAHAQLFTFKCDWCNERFRNPQKLKNHIELVHLKRIVKCPKCGKGFRSTQYMKQHLSVICKNKS